MKLFLINLNECDYDYYDSFVVAARNENEAVKYLKRKYRETSFIDDIGGAEWSKGYEIKEIKISNYKRTTEILGSYNAG